MTDQARARGGLLPRRQFLGRILRSGLAALAAILLSLLAGMVGYHWTEGMPWIDAFVNAAMILSGMGPVGELHTAGGKVFAGCYALYSGLALITIAAILLAPLAHRFLHRFHIELGKDRE